MLEICNSLFRELEKIKVRYCHWKSNSHLNDALCGKTDLDLLVHPDDKGLLFEVFKNNDIKKVISPKDKQFDGIEDHIGFDRDTGRLIHLHLHFRLILGQKYIKNHHLPLEDVFFSHLTFKNNIKVPCPELELLILILRAHMKVDLLSLAKHAIKGPLSPGYTAFPADIDDEFRSLIGTVDLVKFKKITSACALPVSDSVFLDFIYRFSENKLSAFSILLNKKKILSSLSAFKRLHGPGLYLKYIRQCFFHNRLISPFLRQKKKTLNHRGVTISLVGADGSGKSTLVNDLDKWLSWKFDVVRYYYGMPKNLIVLFFDYFIRGLNKTHCFQIMPFVETVLWIYVARKRYRISCLSQRERNRGRIVVTDRFPLREFYDMPQPMDGPRIEKNIARPPRYFVAVEMGYYNKIKLSDCVFVLQTSVEELRKRKSDLDPVVHKMKADAVNSISQNGKFVLVDVGRPYDEVQLDLKKMVWDLL